MANKYWQGGASAVAQVRRWAFAGTWEATDIVRVTIGNRIYDFTAGSTTIDTVLGNMVTAWNALSSTLYPEFAELTASADTGSDYFILTADTAGLPFTVTLAPFESDGSTAGDTQTIEGSNTATTGTAVTANAGPNDWNTDANWSGASQPVDGDVCYFRNTNVSVLDGLDQSSLNLSIVVEQSFTGTIGRPLINAAGYPEYRATYLKIGTDDSPTQSITIGQGQGAGSGRIKIDAGASTTSVVVHNTGNPLEQGIEAFLFKGTDASNTMLVNRGSVGIAVLPYDDGVSAEESATLSTLSVGYVTNPAGDARVRCGSGVTLTTIDQSGGTLEINSGATTITKTAGELTLGGGVTGSAVTVTTLNERGGTTYVTGVTTITTGNLANSGTLDYSRDMRGKIITNALNVYGDKAKFIDPYRVVSSTSGSNVIVDLEQGGALANLNLGSNIKLTRATL